VATAHLDTKPLALITGAAGGIGAALVAGFHGAGYEVIGADRVAGDGVTLLDVTDSSAVAGLAGRIDRLAVLINAAGVVRRQEEYEERAFSNVLDINLTGTMRLSTACKPALVRAGGAIVNIASMYSFFGAPHAPAYAASKAGVVQLTKSLAIAWAADGIRVNALAPGWIETPFTDGVRANEARRAAILERSPMGRWGTPEDLVGPALFLASDAARFVTGAVLPVDGGYSAM
jgi:NAD(P)-dependent dehydrogenase (short-subunit alcohol dehydrogenase family)